MTGLMNQVKFDFKRKYLRNKPFIFFNLLMPIGFYLLFTKVMNTGMPTGFAKQYAVSMIVYSVVITEIFSLARLIVEDRENKFQQFSALVPARSVNYFISIGLIVTLMNLTTTIIIQIIAIAINHAHISVMQFLITCGLVVVGQIPLAIFGSLLGTIVQGKNIDVVGNLLAFPLAIISGLWWPLQLLPHVAQIIGQYLPTYALAQMMQAGITGQPLSVDYILNICAWSIGLMLLLIIIKKRKYNALM